MSTEEEDSVYKRIGGEETIAKLVDSFYEKVLADPDLKFYFEEVPKDKMVRMQREFFSAATGGPIVYSGRPLSEIRRRYPVSLRKFRRFTEHLIETLQEIGIDEKDVYEIIAHLNLYADEITNQPVYGSD